MRVFLRWSVLWLFAVLASAVPSFAQTAGLEREKVQRAPGEPPEELVTIRVDNTGVASWRFRNARNPPRLWDRRTPAESEFKLRFKNDTSGATIKVTLPAVKVPFIPGATSNLIPATLLGLDLVGARLEAQRSVNLSLEAADVAVARSAQEPTDTDRRLLCLAQYVLTHSKESDRRLSELIRRSGAGAPKTATEVDKTIDESVEMKAVADLTAQLLGPGVTVTGCKPESVASARSLLDAWRKANPERAGALPAIAVSAGIDALEGAAAAVQMYAARLSPNEASVEASILNVQELARSILGVTLETCEVKNGDVMCVPTATIAANSEARIDGRLLAGYPARTLIKFRVTFPFALESEQPSFQAGYFVLDDNPLRPPTTAVLSAAGTMAFAREPYLGAATTVVDDDYRYEGAKTFQLRTTARTSVDYSLADRAAATVEVQFKNGIVGRKDEDLAVKVNQYNFQVFGLSGTTLKFGKYLFAAPTDGLAINESGEGITGRYKWLSVSHIVKREGGSGATDPEDRDHRVWLADVTNIALPSTTPLRALSFYGVSGTDNTLGRERRYYTIGGEARFHIPKSFLTGAMAYYDSRSRPRKDTDSAVRDARGNSWMVRASRSWFSGNTPLRIATLTAAAGSGDDDRTTNGYEGYLGENAALAPDGSLFVSTLVPRMRLQPVPFFIVDGAGNQILDKDGNPTPEFAERGLANRSFIGFTFNDQTFSPLEWLSAFSIIPLKDIKSRQTTFRLQHYRSRRLIDDSRPTMLEAQLEFLLESPEGVKTIVKFSRLFTSGRMEPLFPSEPWSAVMQINVSLK